MTTPEEARGGESSDQIAHHLRQLAAGLGASATGGEGPPPDNPPGETTNPGFPERGVFLRQVLQYVAVSSDEIHQDLVDKVMGTETGRMLIDLMVNEQGVNFDAAVEALAFTLYHKAHMDSLTFAEVQYGSALEATGLKIDMGLDGIELRMASPRAFAASLRELPSAADETVQEQLRTSASDAVEDGLTATYTEILFQQPIPVADMYGGDIPSASTLHSALRTTPPEREESARIVAAQLPEQAGAIRESLLPLDPSPELLHQLEVLDLAYQDGKVTEWAAACDLDILDYSEGRIGVDRLTTPEDWQVVYTFLRHLRDTARDKPFTAKLRKTLLRDLHAAIHEDDPTVIPRGRADGWDAIQAEGYKFREEARNFAEQMLLDAVQAVQEILPE
jgi:hypothetical protein